MVKSSKSSSAITHFARRERGVTVPINVQSIKLPDGTAGAVAGIDLSSAEVPEREYLVADACGVEFKNDVLRIMFAQKKLGGELRSMVLISMTPLAANQFIRSVEKMGTPGLDEIAKLVGLVDEPLSEFPAEEPEQTAALPASIVAVAVSGRDVCMDFYHMSAFAHVTLRDGNAKNLNLSPMVRITSMRTSLLVSLVHRLKELRKEFPEDATLWKDSVDDKPL